MGSNQFGKLGFFYSKENAYYTTPKLVESLSTHQFAKVTCGLNHALAVTKDTGVVYSWGSNLHNQLGRHAPLDSNLPAPISYFIKTGTRAVDVSGGGKHSLFLTDEGMVFSVGANDYGQLGYES